MIVDIAALNKRRLLPFVGEYINIFGVRMSSKNLFYPFYGSLLPQLGQKLNPSFAGVPQ